MNDPGFVRGTCGRGRTSVDFGRQFCVRASSYEGSHNGGCGRPDRPSREVEQHSSS